MPTFSLSLQWYLVGSEPPEEDVCVNQNDVLIGSECGKASSKEKSNFAIKSIAVFKLS